MHEERDSPRTVFHCVSCCWNVGWISSKIASCAVKRTPAGKGSERKYLMKSDCWDHCTGRAGETEPEGKPIKNRRKVLKEVRPLYLELCLTGTTGINYPTGYKKRIYHLLLNLTFVFKVNPESKPPCFLKTPLVMRWNSKPLKISINYSPNNHEEIFTSLFSLVDRRM